MSKGSGLVPILIIISLLLVVYFMLKPSIDQWAIDNANVAPFLYILVFIIGGVSLGLLVSAIKHSRGGK